jgi:hypothetical protein
MDKPTENGSIRDIADAVSESLIDTESRIYWPAFFHHRPKGSRLDTGVIEAFVKEEWNQLLDVFKKSGYADQYAARQSLLERAERLEPLRKELQQERSDYATLAIECQRQIDRFSAEETIGNSIALDDDLPWARDPRGIDPEGAWSSYVTYVRRPIPSGDSIFIVDPPILEPDCLGAFLPSTTWGLAYDASVKHRDRFAADHKNISDKLDLLRFRASLINVMLVQVEMRGVITGLSDKTVRAVADGARMIPIDRFHAYVWALSRVINPNEKMSCEGWIKRAQDLMQKCSRPDGVDAREARDWLKVQFQKMQPNEEIGVMNGGTLIALVNRYKEDIDV